MRSIVNNTHRMWMVENGDHDIEMMMPRDPIYHRNLRALVPRPVDPFPQYRPPSAVAFKTLVSFNGTITRVRLTFRVPSSLMYKQKCSIFKCIALVFVGPSRPPNRELSAVPGLVSTRWSPTPEQLETLEEMYRRGARNPSAKQIQQIAARLKKFGKIEGKNVFYWFQNHKAREMQKKRRQIGKKIHRRDTPQTKQIGSDARCVDIQEYDKDKLPVIAVPYSTFCITASQASAVTADCKREGLDHVEQKICWQFDSGTAFFPDNAKPCGLKLHESQTLELFPIERIHQSVLPDPPEEEIYNFSSSVTPQHFIEFLPTRK